MRRHLTFFLLLTVLGCAPAQPANVVTDPAQIREMADWFVHQYGLVEDPQVLEITDRVSNRLSAGLLQLAVASEDKINCHGNFQISVLNTDEIAALSLGEGKIFITRGLLKTLNSESQLAAVIAHEMSHVALGHHTAAELSSKNSSALPQLHLSANEEFAADALSLKILTAAQYDSAASAQALSSLYREISQTVSPQQAALMRERLARLQNALYATGHSLFATQNTRDFQHLKERL